MHSPPLDPAVSPQLSLVLVGPGSTLAGADGEPLADRLAALLEVRRLAVPAVAAAVPERSGDPWLGDPAPLLAALASLEPGWLLPLPCDPGADLAVPGCWADALAAWRQPTVLALPAPTPGTPPGLARAYGALLQSAGVPLLGLVQLGGPWDAAARRQDGLSWLGCLPTGTPSDASTELGLALRQACRRRWRALRPAPQRGQA